MRGLFKFLVFLAIVVGALAYPAVKTLDNSSGLEVLVLLDPANEMQVKFNRDTRQPEDPIAEIYGRPTGEKVRIVLYDQKNVMTPTEDQNARYYLVKDRTKDEPLQVKTLYFLADRAMKFGLGFGIFGLLLLLFLWKPKE